ncbi:Glucuronosyltransferase [Aphelenchoides fujianensis]|nr:Glucuronosyltransferase [Aphelenchoides fujianensis]
MIERLKEEKFDLAILEYFDPCSLGILEAIGLRKYIAVYSMPLSAFAATLVGLPASHSFVPDLHTSFTPQMSFFERLKNVFTDFFISRVMFMKALVNKIEAVIHEEVNPHFDFIAFSEFRNVTFLWRLRGLSSSPASSLFADQRRNARMIEWKGQGLVLDKTKLSKEYLVEHLRRIIEDESFRTKAKEMARMLADKPQSADEKVVAHAVFAAKYDAHAHLDMREARHMNPLQYHNVDVLAFLIAVASLVLYVFYRLLRLAFSCCCRRKTKSKTE